MSKIVVDVAGEPKKKSLIARFTDTMPDPDMRPIRQNYAVRIEAARAVLPNVLAWAGDGVEPKKVEEALFAAVRWETDPMTIAGLFAGKIGREPDAELVKALESYPYESERHFELMLRSWVRLHNIRPRFEIGQRVIITLRPSLLTVETKSGVIVSIEEDTAQYVVRVKEDDGSKRYTVNFEDVSG